MFLNIQMSCFACLIHVAASYFTDESSAPEGKDVSTCLMHLFIQRGAVTRTRSDPLGELMN